MKKRTVFITGASRGIGRATALAFAAEGYLLYLNCRQSAAELQSVQAQIRQQFGITPTLLIGDVGNPDEVTAMFDQILREHGYLDVLVNNAGLSYTGLLSEMTDTAWQEIIQTNLSSVFYCSRAAIPGMVSQKSGKIINISSMWGTAGASCEAAYSAAKSGVHGLTRALAKELAPSNIQVNALACGVIDTRMNAHLTSEERTTLASEIPAGRFGTPEEVAHLVIDLAHGPEYLTGQIIGVDGGYL